MDSEKVGSLIAALRKEHGMTQREVAGRLHVSDKAVSKWETGQGLPDVSLLGALSVLFGVPAECLLAGDLDPRQADGGNMKRLHFYVCPGCGAFLTGPGQAEVSCCGKKLSPLTAQKENDAHRVAVRPVEDEWYLTLDHPMDKGHFISFVAWVSHDRALTVKLYPEGEAALRIPQMRGGGKLYYYCTRHGLFVAEP